VKCEPELGAVTSALYSGDPVPAGLQHVDQAARDLEDRIPGSMMNNSSGAVIVASVDGDGSSDDEVQQPVKF
jgi:hypothetical protein